MPFITTRRDYNHGGHNIRFGKQIGVLPWGAVSPVRVI